MRLETVTLAQRPDLLEQSFALGDPDEPGFYTTTGWLYSAAAGTRWADFTLLLLRGERVVARASTIPFCMGIDSRVELPPDGFDGVVRWAAEDVLVDRKPNCLAALEISVDVASRGTGVSAQALDAVIGLARRLNFAEVVCPVRPTEKSQSPRLGLSEYIVLTRADGLPLDPWVRVHVRAGGEILGVAPFSMVIVDTIPNWRASTGMALEEDGETDLPGGLAPLIVNQRQNVAVYVEPNVWVRHRARPSAET